MIKYRQFNGIAGDVVCEVLTLSESTYDRYKETGLFHMEDEYNALELALNEFSDDIMDEEFDEIPETLSKQIARAVSKGAELLHIHLKKA